MPRTAETTAAAKSKRRDRTQVAKDNAAKRNLAPSWDAALRTRARPLPDAKLIKICREGIPGYDPWRDSEGYTFDCALAKEKIRWIEVELSHVKGPKARQPFILEDWERAVIGNLFGWVDVDGWRRYRKMLLYVPRKNGKTPLAACLVLICLIDDGELGAEVYGAACEYGQAARVFEHARGMVLQNRKLRELCKVYSGQAKAIQLPNDPSYPTYRVVSSDGASMHGGHIHAYVLDELHTQKNDELLEALDTGTAGRQQPLAMWLTTADYAREGSICNKKHDYASKVRDGIIEDARFLPVIYEASRDDDWTDEAVWEAANPNIDISVSREYLRSTCKEAQEDPVNENKFKRLHLNIITEQVERWIVMPHWDAMAGEPVDLEEFRGRRCWGGLDLATVSDLNALVLAFPEDDGSVVLACRFWCPQEVARERERKAGIPYTQWIRDGLVNATPGDEVQYAAIREDIAGEEGILETYELELAELAVDRLFQGVQLVQQLREEDGIEAFAHGQGFYGMAGPTDQFDKLLRYGKIRHGGNPVLRWHASNASVTMDPAGNLKPTREKSAEKIDGIVAAIMAVGRAMGNADDGESVYDKRGLTII